MKSAIYNAVFTLVLCAISAATVTFAKMQWGELQKAHKAGAKIGAIVEAFGLVEDASDDPGGAVVLFKELVTVKTKDGVTIYTAVKDGKPLGTALEVIGRGLEGEIEGILAVAPDKRTVLGFRIHHQEETPGLGARIAEKEFLAQFAGKSIAAEGQEPGIRLVAKASGPNEVDAISGATLSSGALERMLRTRITEFLSGKKQAEVAIVLPKVAFFGNVSIPPGSTAVPPDTARREALSAPEGAVNLASGKIVGASDDEPMTGELEMLTDGVKDGGDEYYVEWFGGEHIQLDLGAVCTIYAIVIWRDHHKASVHQDVVVQISDDPEFGEAVTTVFNNDQDDSAELGAGTDIEYVETFEGKLIKVSGARARYVRVYSGGNYVDEMSRFVELEVWGESGEPSPE